MNATKTRMAQTGDAGLSIRLCRALCRAFSTGPLKSLGMRQRAVGGRFESAQQYVAERVANIEDYRKVFGSLCSFEGKTVMELGCNHGYLLHAFLQDATFTAIGADIDPKALDKGRRLYGDQIRFVQTTPATVPIADASIDVIYCIDTVEHLSRPKEMLLDCYRALRPGGVLLVHWHPWLSPYGSHLEDIIPFPWSHVFFSMDNLLQVAAEIYDSPGYVPAYYWFDEDGNRRANPFLDHQRWAEFLNKMTVSDFRKLIRGLPYERVSFRRVGFGGKAYKAARLLRGLAHVRFADEFFLKAVVCVLRKPSYSVR